MNALLRVAVRPSMGVARKHSNRALKRVRGHPATWEKRGYVPPKHEPLGELRWMPDQAAIEAVPAHGYAPPTGAVPEGLPFRVARTAKGDSLPVYSDYRNGGSRQLTIVRRASGDLRVLAEELSKVCGDVPVTARPGKLEVSGNHSRTVKEYFTGLGL